MCRTWSSDRSVCHAISRFGHHLGPTWHILPQSRVFSFSFFPSPNRSNFLKTRNKWWQFLYILGHKCTTTSFDKYNVYKNTTFCSYNFSIIIYFNNIIVKLGFVWERKERHRLCGILDIVNFWPRLFKRWIALSTS